MKKMNRRNPRERLIQKKKRKVKKIEMKDSGLKLLAEAAVLHPIESEVDKIQHTKESTPNGNSKVGIDNHPKKRVLQLWKFQPVTEETESSQNKVKGKMIHKKSNVESTQMEHANLHDSTNMIDNCRKVDVGEPVAMTSSLTETVSVINAATRSKILLSGDDKIQNHDTIDNSKDTASEAIQGNIFEDVSAATNGTDESRVRQSNIIPGMGNVGLTINDNYSDTVIRNNQYEVVNTTNSQSHISTWNNSSTSNLTPNTDEDNTSIMDRHLIAGTQQLNTTNSTNEGKSFYLEQLIYKLVTTRHYSRQ